MESKFAIVHFKNGLIFIVNKQVQFVDETGRVVGGQESKDAFDKLYKDANPNTGDDKWPLDPKDLFKSKMSELDQSKVLPKEWLLKYYGDRQGIRLNEFTNAALEKALKNPEMVPIKLITEGEFAIVSYQTPKGKNLILIVNSTPQFVDTQKMPSIIAQSAAVFSRIFVVQEKPDQFVVNQIAKSLIPNCPQVDFEFVATSFVFLQPKHT
jgi:hypothetical protein